MGLKWGLNIDLKEKAEVLTEEYTVKHCKTTVKHLLKSNRSEMHLICL